MPRTQSKKSPKTLCVDIGGTGLKIMLVDANDKPLTDRLRTATPKNATPERVLAVLDELRKQVPNFDQIAAGFPGVVKRGTIFTAANLHPKWVGIHLQSELEKLWNRPARVANDAAVQGYGAIQGKGVEMILTLGTGLGSAIYVEGMLCPGLELGHHPWQKGKSYEDFLGRKGLKKVGKKRWNKLLEKAIAQTHSTFNWDRLYLGGGNAKLVKFKLPENVSIVPNEDGLLGGPSLWKYES